MSSAIGFQAELAASWERTSCNYSSFARLDFAATVMGTQQSMARNMARLHSYAVHMLRSVSGSKHVGGNSGTSFIDECSNRMQCLEQDRGGRTTTTRQQLDDPKQSQGTASTLKFETTCPKGL